MQRIELHTKTKYSQDHESTIDIKKLILKCMENKEKGVAIIDYESIVSFFKAERILKELNIKNFKLIYGVELKVYYNDNTYKAIVLAKNKIGISSLYKVLNVYNNHKKIPLSWIITLRKNFVLGLIYEPNNYNDELLKYFDYIEVDNKISKKEIEKLKDKLCVVYSNRINALTEEEILAKKILYNKLRIKKEIDNRQYQSTKEILNKIKDEEIVIKNPNKIFNMIEKFNILDNKMNLPSNTDFDIDIQVYLELYKKYGINIPNNIKDRVDKELKLIKEYNYEGFINIYKKITDKCKISKEEYSILDYTNYLLIAYILGITDINPIKLNLNYELFFTNNPKISIKTTNIMSEKLRKFIREELKLNIIYGKSLMKLDGIKLDDAINKYENKNNIKLSLKEKVTVAKYLDNYPINNNLFTLKGIILPGNKENYFPVTSFINDKKQSILYTQIDYKDIEDKFMIIEILSSEKQERIKHLKEITKDKINNYTYKDKTILNKKELKNYLNNYKNSLILDDFYEELINSNIELPTIFNIINEIKKEKNLSKKTKTLLNKNNIKLKKYHNINLISRGILYELVKIEYKLLYFKEYYPLEYYYITLKKCPFNEYVELIKKINNKKIDKLNNDFKYNYLNIIKEAYEYGIKIDMEEDILAEYYHLKLDKLNNKLILVINKVENEVNKYLNNNLSIIGTRPFNGKMEYISKILYNILNRNKKVILFGFGGPTNYYLEFLLSETSKIDRKIIRQYLNPCSHYKNEIYNIDEENYLKAIKYLLNHKVIINDYHSTNNIIIENTQSITEKIIYLSNNYDVVIIDNIEIINDNLENILKNISKLKKLILLYLLILKENLKKTKK